MFFTAWKFGKKWTGIKIDSKLFGLIRWATETARNSNNYYWCKQCCCLVCITSLHVHCNNESDADLISQNIHEARHFITLSKLKYSYSAVSTKFMKEFAIHSNVHVQCFWWCPGTTSQIREQWERPITTSSSRPISENC